MGEQRGNLRERYGVLVDAYAGLSRPRMIEVEVGDLARLLDASEFLSVACSENAALRAEIGGAGGWKELCAGHEAVIAALRARLERAVPEFVARVNARAEADILAGSPVTGAHHRALEAELASYDAEPQP